MKKIFLSKRIKLIGLVFLALAVALLYSLFKNGSLSDIQIIDPLKPEPKLPDFYSCGTDADCVWVNADGCGCSAGGTATAINGKYINEWNLRFPKTFCPAVISMDWTCINSEPKCSNNRCILIEGEKQF
ncbi:MAG: hypothetical protein HYT21_01740 [Candidatus Nealsonbacteria bacterium]|nr:hypothetical protein [Candidatus Nealsonbacteria bacterium]